MNRYRADFHNHSCLSPCGSLELSPKVLVQRAYASGIQILALTDHNSARNTVAFETLSHQAGIFPVCGLEVTTVEELHCLALFRGAVQALEFGDFIENHLQKIPNRPEAWGDQPVVDESDTIQELIPFFLGTATDLSLSDLGTAILQAGGWFIPAHVDRSRDSLQSQLGRLPELPFTALEIRRQAPWPIPPGLALVRGSDAHYPENVGERTFWIEAEELTWGALTESLAAGATGWDS